MKAPKFNPFNMVDFAEVAVMNAIPKFDPTIEARLEREREHYEWWCRKANKEPNEEVWECWCSAVRNPIKWPESVG